MSGSGGKVAVVSASLRLPGATSAAGYWANLMKGTDTITRDREVPPDYGQSPLGVPPTATFVPAYGRIDLVTSFDPERFGMSAAEALRTDPQQRVLLEVVDEALHTGAVSAAGRASAAVFVGTGLNSYESVVRRRLGNAPGIDDFAVELGVARDYVAGKLAYHLNLRGMATNVLAACSTALVAVHLGVRVLQADEADVAVVGVSAIRYPLWQGYWAVPGTISAPDGVCRPFDASASGTVPADGAGALVLKRLDDALAANDDILGVVRGSMTNNDGAKPGFAHVSAASQRAVITGALRQAELDPADLSYLESHGTGTRLGDAVEWSALQKVFGGNDRPLHVGAVKGNIGHTREAAGFAGLVKAMLCLRHGTVPPTANYGTLPPDLYVGCSPVQPVPAAVTLPAQGPRYAGVSSFGLGGTNGHVVLESAPPRPSAASPGRGVVLLSSHRPETLQADTEALRPALTVGDGVADGLAARSKVRAAPHHFRRYVTYDSRTGAESALTGTAVERRTTRTPRRPAKVIFAFSGVGSEYPGMGAAAYGDSLDETVAIAAGIGVDVAGVFVRPANAGPGTVDLRKMLRRGLSEPASDPFGILAARHLALFAIQLAYADTLRDAGVRPAAVVGHSLGEWTAATVAGAIDRADAIRLIARRATLIEQAPDGVTVAVAAGADAVRPLLDRMVIAADNSPQSCAVSGPAEDAAAFEDRLLTGGLVFRRLDARAAFHNQRLGPAAAELGGWLRDVELRDPAVPMASSVTGAVLGPGAMTAAHWSQQLTEPVRFREALAALAERYDVLVELGPGNIRPWAMQTASSLTAVRTTPMSYEGVDAVDVYEQALAELWLHGHNPRWPQRAGVPVALEDIPVPALNRRVFDPEPPRTEAPAEAPPPAVAVGPARRPDPAGPKNHAQVVELIGDLWCALLGLDHVDADDHFFDLGGDSLLGRHLIAMIAEVTGVEVPGQVVFAAGSLNDMAGFVHRWIASESGEESS